MAKSDTKRELHQHKLQPRLLIPSKGFESFSDEVCAARVLAISTVRSEATDVLLPAVQGALKSRFCWLLLNHGSEVILKC